MSPARSTSTSRPATGRRGRDPALDVPQLSLRERKKIRTRQTIRREAYRLFEEGGYETTTVDQIAAAAEVSPSTFFRYFPTKEDLVLSDDYDPVMQAALRARPRDEPLLLSVRHAIVESLRALQEYDPDEVRIRTRLLRDVPAIRARMSESVSASCRMIAEIVAERMGRPADDFRARVLSGAVLGAFEQAIMHWADEDGSDGENLEQLIERTLDVLTEDLTA